MLEAEGTYVDVTVYTRRVMPSALPCPQRVQESGFIRNRKKICYETRSEPALQEGQPALTATGVSVSVAVASTRASPVRAASPTGEGRSCTGHPCLNPLPFRQGS